VLEPRDGGLWFHYADSYLSRTDAVSLWASMPLGDSWAPPTGDLGMPGPIRDAHPDGWGRQVIRHRLGTAGSLSHQDYLLRSESNRFGAVDFQARSDQYFPRGVPVALDDLAKAAQAIAANEPLPEALEAAALHGTSMGGARPKATATDAHGVQWIAKFSQSSDAGFDAVGAEAAAMFLAARAGIDVAQVGLSASLGRKVLLVRRFDRRGGARSMCVSGLTVLGLDEMGFRYGRYPDLVAAVAEVATIPESVGPELFARIAFNMAVSNFDDHLRNHAVFWDGSGATLTPAFDLAPGPRSGETGAVAMAYDRDGHREANWGSLIRASHFYGLTRRQSRERLDRLRAAIEDGWDEACEFAQITDRDKGLLWGRQFANPATFRDL
jgi:serine/threonine-protein kinase HipA